MRFHHFMLLLNRAARAMVIAVFVCAMPAMAADTRVIGAFTDWSAHQFTETEGEVCYLYSEPKREQGDYSRRGDTYVQVTHRVGEKTKNVISITAGYPYRKDSEVMVNIDGKKFKLFTDGDTAWAGDAAADSAIIESMRAGRNMVVQGRSTRGTLTTDTYSLSGFTAAHEAINKACGMN